VTSVGRLFLKRWEQKKERKRGGDGKEERERGRKGRERGG